MCVYSRHTLYVCVYMCSKCCIHTFIHHIFLIQVYRQYEYLVMLSGFLSTFLAKSSSKADPEQSCGSLLAVSRQRPTPIHSVGFSCLLQKHPVPLQFGASSTETVGKPLLYLHRYFSCCPEVLRPVSSDGSFAKCLPRPRLGGLQWGFQFPQAPSRCPCCPPSPGEGVRAPAAGGTFCTSCPPALPAVGLVAAGPLEPVRGGLPQRLCVRPQVRGFLVDVAVGGSVARRQLVAYAELWY